MVQVAPIKLNVGPKVLWFDPAGVELRAGDHVIVRTERGHEFGECTSGIMDVSDELIAKLNSPLKPVLRIATEADEEKNAELKTRADEALIAFRRLVQETNTDMHPVEVEFLFDGEKAVFFFEAEERVDFRELVRRLASEFHVRVDMRQIGVRDAARMIGGLGHCGQELCCRRMGGEFNPVTIRMAKEQGLSLNPQKISGCCGRLMCCLRYEFETYKEFNSRAPKLGAKVDVPDGIAKVTDVSMPTETIALRLEDGKTIRVPLEEFEEPEPGRRPHVLSEETYERYTSESPLDKLDSSLFSGSTTSFTGEDALADPKSPARSRKSEASESGRAQGKSSGRKPRRRGADAAEANRAEASSKSRRSRSGRAEAEGTSRPERSTHRKRRRRSSDDSTAAAAEQLDAASAGKSEQTRERRPRKSGVRPGQKSSGLRNAEARKAEHGQATAAESAPSAPSAASKPEGDSQGKPSSRSKSSRRRSSRSRSNKKGAMQAQGTGSQSQAKGGSDQAGKANASGQPGKQGGSGQANKPQGARRTSGEHRRPRRRSSGNSENRASNNANNTEN
ncbi:MAG: regulatory iron-sulfur-containing complex subunit RicT [Coriobacteriia bacterium]|nr:regulatory iron-sulfur-containing complex subunit RicT [Coriobacteriia bacterium]